MNQIIYYLYHIPGKKIGVTRNLKNRLTVQQGYQPSEYEVLETSLDIDYISNREAELQLLYGYKIDRDTYKSLMNKFKTKKQMKLNVTEQTVTFPCPVNKLKGQLMDAMGLNFETQYGKYILDQDMAEWIVKNASTSMFNSGRSFIYNKALAEWYKHFNQPLVPAENIEVNGHLDVMDQIDDLVRDTILKANLRSQEERLQNAKKSIKDTLQSFEKAMLEAERRKNEDELPNVYDLIRDWAANKGIYASGDSKTQYVKLMEEAGELAQAILKRDKPEIKDAIGDMVVVLTNLAHLEGFDIEDCITSAYTVIKDRTGEMQNGTFVKSTTGSTTIGGRFVNNHLTSTL
jgi:NTP pyrophosphatase (non-canonical NTP hydrolase)